MLKNVLNGKKACRKYAVLVWPPTRGQVDQLSLFATVTAQYLDDKWVLVNKVLVTKEYTVTHTADITLLMSLKRFSQKSNCPKFRSLSSLTMPIIYRWQ